MEASYFGKFMVAVGGFPAMVLQISGEGRRAFKGTVRIGIALALLAAVMLAIFTLSSPVKAVSAGDRNNDDLVSEPLRVEEIANGIRFSSNSIKFLFINPYEFVDSFSVKCKESDDSVVDIKTYRLYRLRYEDGFKIRRLRDDMPIKGANYLIITQPPSKGSYKKCWVDITTNGKTGYSKKVRRGEKWFFNSVPGYNVITDCVLRLYELKTYNDGRFSIKSVRSENSRDVDLNAIIGTNKVYYIINTKNDCSFALVPEQSVVEFCSSLMERNVCEEASYIKANEQASCMGEGGKVCIMPFDSVVDGETTMWGCCK